MILVNTDYITGKELETLGLVRGSTIQSKNIGKDITQSFKTLVGGELKAYTKTDITAEAIPQNSYVHTLYNIHDSLTAHTAAPRHPDGGSHYRHRRLGAEYVHSNRCRTPN